MKIFVLVKTGARQEGIKKISGNTFRVAVKEKPIQGRANREVLEVLAEYFGISRSSVRILSGAASKKKLMEIIK